MRKFMKFDPITSQANLTQKLTFSGSGCLHFSAEGFVVEMERLQDSDQQTGGEVQNRGKKGEKSDSRMCGGGQEEEFFAA